MSLGVTLSQAGQIVAINVKKPTVPRQPQHLLNRKKGIGRLPHDPFHTDVPQAILDTQAQAALKDLFPNIPDEDVLDIISRAFQKV